MKAFAQQSPARRTANDGDGIVVGEFAAESRAARAQTDISGSPGHGGAAREQAHGTGKRKELNEYFFHNCFWLWFIWADWRGR
jgi:hypothetical protein